MSIINEDSTFGQALIEWNGGGVSEVPTNHLQEAILQASNELARRAGKSDVNMAPGSVNLDGLHGVFFTHPEKGVGVFDCDTVRASLENAKTVLQGLFSPENTKPMGDTWTK